MPSWISDWNDFSYFWPASHPNASCMFRVKWPFGSGEEAKNRFSRLPPWLPSWIFDWNDFSCFWSKSHPDVSYQVSNQLAFWLSRRRKIDFQDGHHAILDFRLERFELFLIYKSPQCFLPSFESIGLLVQEKKWKIDFQDGCHLGFLINDFSYFLSTS